MYLELDPDLVPGKISDINTKKDLPTGKVEVKKKDKKYYDIGDMTSMKVKKYKIHKGDLFQAIKSQDKQRIQEVKDSKTEYQRYSKYLDEGSEAPQSRSKNLSNFEAVAGSKSVDLKYDHDWGFFSTILACYNNHWVLRTSPDDWWNVIVRNIAQAVDTNGERTRSEIFL